MIKLIVINQTSYMSCDLLYSTKTNFGPSLLILDISFEHILGQKNFSLIETASVKWHHVSMILMSERPFWHSTQKVFLRSTCSYCQHGSRMVSEQLQSNWKWTILAQKLLASMFTWPQCDGLCNMGYLDSLKRSLKTSWDEISQEIIRASCLNATKRLEAVVEAEGGYFEKKWVFWNSKEHI